MRSVLALAAVCGLASAHFKLTTPNSIGFSDDDEGKAPCGGFTPDLSKDLVDFHVGGEALGVNLFHPQSTWLFRVTTDSKAQSGWEQLYPIVQQSGLGAFCLPKLTVPESYVGKKGVVSVVSHATDGLLYQCIAANFVKGEQSSVPGACKNASIKVSFTDDSQLTALVSKSGGSSSQTSSETMTASSSSSSGTGTATGTPTGSTAGPTTSSAASSLQSWPGAGSVAGSLVVVSLMALLGGLMMI